MISEVSRIMWFSFKCFLARLKLLFSSIFKINIYYSSDNHVTQLQYVTINFATVVLWYVIRINGMFIGFQAKSK